MTLARAIEYRIIRQSLERCEESTVSRESLIAERLISVAVLTTALLVGGSYLPELVAAAVAASGLWATAG